VAHDREQWRGLFEHGHETLWLIKDGEFLDWLSDYHLLNEGSSHEITRVVSKFPD